MIYIIEDIGTNNEAYRKYQEATESAIASTQVVDGYFVKRTQTVDDTIRYLARMTMLLKSVYEVMDLPRNFSKGAKPVPKLGRNSPNRYTSFRRGCSPLRTISRCCRTLR